MKISIIPAYTKNTTATFSPAKLFASLPKPVEAVFVSDSTGAGLSTDGGYVAPEGCDFVGISTDSEDQRFSIEEVEEIVALVKAGYPVNRIDFISVQ